MSSQTVYFTNPTVINNIQTDVATNTTNIASNTTNIAAMSGALGVQYRQDALGKPQFLHGVASGDPSATTMVIQTCLTYTSTLADKITVRYVVGTGCSGSFDNPNTDVAGIVTSGIFTTNPSVDYSVKVRLTGLVADTVYYYKFFSLLPGASDVPNQQDLITYRTNNEYTVPYSKSPIGRFRTLPATGSSPTQLKLATVNCQNINNAWFNHCYQMAKAAKAGYLDYCIYIGDAVYSTWGLNRVILAGVGKPCVDANGVQIMPTSYEEYCQVHRAYKSDPDLQEMYRSLSLIVVYNDHEIRNDTLINPTYLDRSYNTDWVYNYNMSGTSFSSALPQNGTVPATGALPMDDTQGLMQRALRAWYDHLPMWGAGSYAGIDGTVNFSMLTGYTPLDRTYRLGNLCSIHILDDVAQNVASGAQINPFYNALTTYFPYALPNSTGPEGATGCIAFPVLQSAAYGYGTNTGAFIDDVKKVLRWQKNMLGEREAIKQSQLNNLRTQMSGSNTAWNIVIISYRKNSFWLGPITDGYIPETFLTDYSTGAYNSSDPKTIPFIFSAFPYNTGSNGLVGTYVNETLPWIALAQKQLYEAGESPYLYNQACDTSMMASWRTRDGITDVLKDFKNTIVLSGDQHDNFIGHMHTRDTINYVITGGREGGTGYWLNYQTSTGSIDISTNTIVGTVWTPMLNTNIFSNFFAQSFQDQVTSNGIGDFMKFQWPGFVEWSNISLLNSRGFSTIGLSSTGATLKNIFVGGFSTGAATGANAQTIRNLVDTFRTPNNIFTGLNGRQDVLQLCAQYVIPRNTTSYNGNQPLQIVKAITPRWRNYLPSNYVYYQPVNQTVSPSYYSYNDNISISQI